MDDLDIANAALEIARTEAPTPPKQPAKITYLPDLNRLLPQSPEAEQGVLCSFMLAPREVGSLLVSKRIKAEIMHIPAHATFFQVLMDLWTEGKPLDFIHVAQTLKDRGELERVGGAAFVSMIHTLLPSAAEARHYLEIIEDKATLRKMIATCGRYGQRAHDEQEDAKGLLEECERDVMAIRRTEDRGGISAKEAMAIGIESIQRRIDLNGQIGGISTGFPTLDKITDGVNPTATAVCGLSGTGKSALVMQIFEHMAVELGIPVAIWPLEMSIRQMTERLIASRARVNMVPWRYGTRANESEKERLVKAAAEISRAKIFFQPSSDCMIQQVRTNARHLVAMHGIKALMIDSMTVFHSDTRQARDNRQREVSECAEGLKELSKELNIAVFLIVHIDRELPRNARPTPKSIRESAAIQQAFDNLWMIYEPDWQDGEPANLSPRMGIYLPKQRDGEPEAEQMFTFEKRFTRFREIYQEPEQGQAEFSV